MRPHLLFALAAILPLTPRLDSASPSETPNSKPQTPNASPSAPAPADYPLKTCVVSNDTLSADYITYTHQQPGKPDVTFRLCCESCIEELRQDPTKFIKKLEDAKAPAKPKPTPPPSRKS